MYRTLSKWVSSKPQNVYILSLLILWVVLIGGASVHLSVIGRSHQRHVLWFPDATGSTVQAEWRNLPSQDTLHKEVRQFINELILGPSRIGSAPFITAGTSLESIVLDENNRLFINFAGEALLDTEIIGQSLEDVIVLLQRNLKHNFRNLREIRVTVHGQELGAPFVYFGAEMDNSFHSRR